MSQQKAILKPTQPTIYPSFAHLQSLAKTAPLLSTPEQSPHAPRRSISHEDGLFDRPSLSATCKRNKIILCCPQVASRTLFYNESMTHRIHASYAQPGYAANLFGAFSALSLQSGLPTRIVTFVRFHFTVFIIQNLIPPPNTSIPSDKC